MKKTLQQWRDELDEQTFRVCRLGETEPPFSGELLHQKANGRYYCACCGAVLFSSKAKFDSGCGWPSFDESIVLEAIRYLEDSSHGMRRVEVRCRACDAHLGHVFDDGPTQTQQRYCINSVALNFTADEAD